jgi:hypothetical protein
MPVGKQIVAAKLFNSNVFVSSKGYLKIISGFIAGNFEHSSCLHGAGKVFSLSTSMTFPSFCGKEAIKKPSQNVSRYGCFIPLFF